MWEIWLRSKALNKAPSDLLGVRGYKAYCLDRGIWMFGTDVENKMDEAESKASNSGQARIARKQALMKCLNPGETRGLYRDPAAGSATPKGSENVDILNRPRVGAGGFRRRS